MCRGSLRSCFSASLLISTRKIIELARYTHGVNSSRRSSTAAPTRDHSARPARSVHLGHALHLDQDVRMRQRPLARGPRAQPRVAMKVILGPRSRLYSCSALLTTCTMPPATTSTTARVIGPKSPLEPPIRIRLSAHLSISPSAPRLCCKCSTCASSASVWFGLSASSKRPHRERLVRVHRETRSW